jgi:DNA-binding transcriptional LysR family regulator
MSREHKKIERLFLFSEIAKQLSFTKAAVELGISKGYLSEQIKQLEVEFGRPLLIRSTRNVKLTTHGELILASMEQIKQSLLDLDRSIRHDNANISGKIRITAPSQFTQRYLMSICNEFQQRHSDIQISIDCSYQLLDLAKNDFDLAFRATSTPPLNMVAKKLFDYRQICCASPEYLSKFGTPKTIADLQHHRCLTSTDKSSWTLNQESVTPPNRLSINDNQMLKELSLKNYGIILVAEYLVDREIAAGKLQELFSEYKTNTSSIYILYPQLIHQSARISSFIQFATDWFQEHFSSHKK